MRPRKPRPKPSPWTVRALGLCLVVIAVSEAFFLLDVAADMLHLDIDTSWIDHSNLELASVVALGLALVAIGKALRDLLRERRGFQATVKAASGRFLDVVDAKFDDWALTASEREIAYLLMKGLSVQEIGDLRATRPGTIKSHSNAIYRKANVRGRNELVAYFVEDLLAGENLVAESRPPAPNRPGP